MLSNLEHRSDKPLEGTERKDGKIVMKKNLCGNIFERHLPSSSHHFQRRGEWKGEK
jgi:hypothetical protein